jgi:SAM-dependent methyltransferase
MHGPSPNYRYVLERALELAAAPSPRILDFGCGTGQLLQLADEMRVEAEFLGTDTFDGRYRKWSEAVPAHLRPRMRPVESGQLPFEDGFFDAVVANQVFEHIAEPCSALSEICRVLKPGGAFLALFPTRDIWFEGHCGLYFPHWLHRLPRLQLAYLAACRSLGFGFYREKLAVRAWAKHMSGILREACFYHDFRDVTRWWESAFGERPQSLAIDYMLWRIERHPRLKRLKSLARIPGGASLLAFVCRKRAGRVLLVRKAAGAGGYAADSPCASRDSTSLLL